jgi:hypothetical protein
MHLTVDFRDPSTSDHSIFVSFICLIPGNQLFLLTTAAAHHHGGLTFKLEQCREFGVAKELQCCISPSGIHDCNHLLSMHSWHRLYFHFAAFWVRTNVWAVFCCGFACIQSFSVENLGQPDSLTDWHFTSMPNFSWILVTTTGFALLLYGFVGIWISDRRRKLWRLNLHRTLKAS